MRSLLFLIEALFYLYGSVKMLVKSKKPIKNAQVLIALSFLALVPVFVVSALFTMKSMEGAIWTDIVFVLFSPITPFLYYLFIRELTDKEGIRAKDLLPFLPILLVWALSGIVYISLGKAGWESLVSVVRNRVESPHPVLFDIYNWGFKIFLLAMYSWVLLYGSKRLKIYNSYLENFYSEIRGLASNMDTYTTLFTYISFSLITVFLLATSSESSSTPLSVILCLGACILPAVVSYYCCGITRTAKEISAEMAEADKRGEDKQTHSANSGSNGPAKYSKALRQAIEDKVYLEQDIALVDLADRIGTNRTYLSNIIRDEYGQNFSEFINSRRISYAIKMMKENEGEQYPMRYIAMKCGYSSLQTFYNNFSRYTGGKTPATYLKNSSNG